MKFLLLVFSFCMLFTGCSKQAGQNQVPQKSVEELKKELLEAACDDQIKKEFEEEIAKKTKRLNEKQLKVSLKKMKDNLKCK